MQLSEANFNAALQASCSIPFVLKAIHNIPGAPPGAYWDGGITDYHLHLNYASIPDTPGDPALVLYPHFQSSVIPGWLGLGSFQNVSLAGLNPTGYYGYYISPDDQAVVIDLDSRRVVRVISR